MEQTTDIRIKRKQSSGHEGVSVVDGELYYNKAQKTLYIGESDDELKLTPVTSLGYVYGECVFIRVSEGRAEYMLNNEDGLGDLYTGRHLTLEFNEIPSECSSMQVDLLTGTESPIFQVDLLTDATNLSEVIHANTPYDFIVRLADGSDPNKIVIVSSGGSALVWEEF